MIWIPPKKNINTMEGVKAFIKKWDSPQTGDLDVYNLSSTPYGNINESGTPGGLSAPSIPKWHPQFISATEEGVREIVFTIAFNLNWITYTSCQGHNYENFSIPNAELHVGILPRNTDEEKKIAAFLENVIREINVRYKFKNVEIGLVKTELLDPGISVYTVIDLYLLKLKDSEWHEYFSELPLVSRKLCEWIDKTKHKLKLPETAR